MGKRPVFWRVSAYRKWLSRDFHPFWRSIVEARRRDMERFGKLFLPTFPKTVVRGKRGESFVVSLGFCRHEESPLSIGIRRQLAGGKLGEVIGEMMLGFERKAVVIIPEGKRGAKAELDSFSEAAGQPWANHLAGEIEKHARHCGLRECKIPRPETLEWYKEPATEIEGDAAEAERIREQMRALFYGLAKAIHYRKGKAFFVKRLQ